MYAEVIIDLNATELDRIFDYKITIDSVKAGSLNLLFALLKIYPL